MALKHSLHRKPSDAKSFYAIYCVLIAVAAALVLMPNVPLGLLTNAVQTMAGVLLPSASVFLLLLCNDKQVLGPWVNKRLTNVFTAVIVGVLVVLSIVLTAAVVFPDISGERIVEILVVGGVIGLMIGIGYFALRAHRMANGELPEAEKSAKPSRKEMDSWRMHPLDQLVPARLSGSTRIWMGVLRGYLVIAVLMVVIKVVQLAG